MGGFVGNSSLGGLQNIDCSLCEGVMDSLKALFLAFSVSFGDLHAK